MLLDQQAIEPLPLIRSNRPHRDTSQIHRLVDHAAHETTERSETSGEPGRPLFVPVSAPLASILGPLATPPALSSPIRPIHIADGGERTIVLDAAHSYTIAVYVPLSFYTAKSCPPFKILSNGDVARIVEAQRTYSAGRVARVVLSEAKRSHQLRAARPALSDDKPYREVRNAED